MTFMITCIIVWMSPFWHSTYLVKISTYVPPFIPSVYEFYIKTSLSWHLWLLIQVYQLPPFRHYAYLVIISTYVPLYPLYQFYIITIISCHDVWSMSTIVPMPPPLFFQFYIITTISCYLWLQTLAIQYWLPPFFMFPLLTLCLSGDNCTYVPFCPPLFFNFI